MRPRTVSRIRVRLILSLPWTSVFNTRIVPIFKRVAQLQRKIRKEISLLMLASLSNNSSHLKWAEAVPQFSPAHSSTIQRAVFQKVTIHSTCNPTRFILSNKQTVEITTAWVSTTGSMWVAWLAPVATTLWTTCTPMRELWWLPRRTLTLKIFMYKWFSKYRERKRYCKKSKEILLIKLWIRLT